ncbi:MAG TPA: hypothetical protein VGI81_00380 [Tepidisphaeraceae bacterium]|jgi:hypothetical protein
MSVAGGMKKTDRDAAQDAFMAGKTDLIVATNAFGIVMAYEGDKIVVLFDTEGSKSLVTDFVLKHDLLERI